MTTATLPARRAASKPSVERPRRKSPWDFVGLGALTIGALLFLLPIYVMLMAGLKTGPQVDAAHMWELPDPISLDGFSGAWTSLGPNFLNSLVTVIPATIITSLIGAGVGYVFSKLPFRFSKLTFALLMMGMFIPYQVILVPMVQFLMSVGLYGTIPGLVLVHSVYGIPIATLIFHNYFASLPHELIEAGQMDGAGHWMIFNKIIMPLSLPGFVVCGIFQFTNQWNDFLFGITVLPDPTKQPITVALNNLSGNFSVDWNTVMAGALIAAVPTGLVYILLGRFFVRGLTAGSIK